MAPKKTEPTTEELAQALKKQDSLQDFQAAALGRRIQALEEAKPLEARLESTTRPRFLTLPDGHRISLRHIESYKAAGDRGVHLRMQSGQEHLFEVALTGGVELQQVCRDQVLRALDDQVKE